MSKNKKLGTSDELDLDFNFDEDFGNDFDLVNPSETSSKNRNPVLHGAKIVGSALLNEMGGIATNSKFISDSIKKTLPNSYGTAIDFGGDALEGVSKIYENASKQAGPAIKDFKKSARKIVSKEAAFVPKWAQSLLDKWEDETKDYQQSSVEQQRNDSIASNLNSMFAANLKQQIETNVQDNVARATDNVINTKRHAQEMNVLNRMQMNLSSIDQFNTNIVLSVAKKSLELQYRSLFVLQDILKTNIDSNNTTKIALEKIRHNTALPDYLKFKNGEFRSMIFKQSLSQSLYGSMLGKGKDMFKVLIDSTNEFVGNKVKDIADSARDAIDKALTIKGDIDSADDPDLKMKIMAGVAASMGLGEDTAAGKKVRGVIKKPINFLSEKYKQSSFYTKNKKSLDQMQGFLKDRNSVIGGALTGQNQYLEDRALIAKDELERHKELTRKLQLYNNRKLDETDEDYNEVKQLAKLPWYKRLLNSAANRAKTTALENAVQFKDQLNTNAAVNTSKIETMRQGGMGLKDNYFYTKQTDMTINKVIPGFLSKMLQELTAIRSNRNTLDANEQTGESAIEEHIYDPTIGALSTKSGIKQNAERIRKDIVKKSAIDEKLANFFDKSNIASYYYRKYRGDKAKAAQGIKNLKSKFIQYGIKNQNGSITGMLEPNIKEQLALTSDEVSALEMLAGSGNGISERYISLKENAKRIKNYEKANELWIEARSSIPDMRKSFEMYESAGLGDVTKDIFNVKSKEIEGSGGDIAFAQDAQGVGSKIGNELGDHLSTVRNSKATQNKARDKRRRDLEAARARTTTNNPDMTGVSPNMSMGGRVKRRNYATGGEVVGPGPVGQDSSRAIIIPDPSTPTYEVGRDVMLAPGEHVIPTDAVAGIGGGNLEAGHRALTELIRKTSILGKKAKRKLNRQIPVSEGTQYAKRLLNNVPANARANLDNLLESTRDKSDEYLGKAKDKLLSMNEDIKTRGVYDKNKSKASEFADSAKGGFNKVTQAGGFANNKLSEIISLLGTIAQTSAMHYQIAAGVAAAGGLDTSKLSKLNIFKWFKRRSDNAGVETNTDAVKASSSLVDKVWAVSSYAPKQILKGSWWLLKNSTSLATKTSIGITKGVVSAPFKLASKVFRKVEGDIYITGENEPRLTRAGMKSGMYVDKKTGKLISTFKDITGEVINSQTGLTVIAEDDFSKAYIKYESGVLGKIIKGTFSLTGKALSGALGLFVDSTTLAGKASAAMLKLAVGAVKIPFKVAGMLLNSPIDIYVKDETGKLSDAPRLTAILMKEGYYFSKRSQKPIRRPTDIDGVVIDKDGNEVITAEDFKYGIYDNQGKLVKGPWTKIFRFGTSAIGAVVKPFWWALKAATKASVGLTKAVGKGLWGGAKAFGRLITGKGLFGRSTEEVTAISSSNAVTVLEQVRDILLNSTIVSKKFRDGAWQTRAKKEKEKSAAAQNGKEKEPGFLSKMWGSLKGLVLPMVTAAGAALMPLLTSSLKLISAPLGLITKGLTKFAPMVLTLLGGIVKALGGESLIDSAEDLFDRKKGGRKGGNRGSRAKALELGYDSMRDRKNDVLSRRADRMRARTVPQLPNPSARTVPQLPNPSARTVPQLTGPSAANAGARGAAYGTGKRLGAGAARVGAKVGGSLKALKGLRPTVGSVIGTGVLLGANYLAGEDSTVGKVAGGVADVANYAAMGALAGSVIPGVGTLVGGIVGGLIGGGVALYNNKDSISEWWSGTTMKTIRYSMYGVPSGSTGYASSVQSLEKVLLKYSKMGKEFTLNESNLTQEMLASAFGIDPDDEQGVATVMTWYSRRFKPVFSHFAAMLSAYDPKLQDFSKLDNAKDEDKVKMVGVLNRIPADIYNITKMPPMVGEGSDVCPTMDEVKALISKFTSKLNISKEKIDMLQSNSAKAMGVTSELYSTTDLNNKTKVVIAEASASLNNESGEVTTTSMSEFSVQAAKRGLNRDKLSAIDSIRMRQYGLKDLELNKVLNLFELEDFVSKRIAFKSDGMAYFNSTGSVVFSQVKGLFLISDISSVTGRKWINWFFKRFLHVYLTYVSALKAVGVNDYYKFNSDTLDPKKTSRVAEWLVAAKPWDALESPWDSYTLNSDPKSVEENLLYVRKMYSEKLIKENTVIPAVANANIDVTKKYGTSRDNASASLRTLDNAILNANINPDKETKPTSSSGFTTNGGGVYQKPNSITVATGALMSGSGADRYLKLADKGVNFTGLNPDFQRLMRGAIEEYGTKTGKSVTINAAHRTYQQQEALYRRDPSKAAPPGTSPHESGLAIDINTEILDEMDKMGILKKYGLFRPLSGESWHLEPIGVQSVLRDAKTNPELARSAINSGVGKGGSGAGDVMRKDSKIKRYPDMVKEIMGMSGKPVEDKSPAMQRLSGEEIVKSISDTNAVDLDQKKNPVTSVNPSKNVNMPMTGVTSASANPDAEVKSSVSASRAPVNLNGKLPIGNDPSSNFENLTLDGNDEKSIKSFIRKASNINGIDENTALITAFLESSFKPNAGTGNNKGGSAKGIFQFIDSSWSGYLSQYIKANGTKAGLTMESKVTDPRANIILGTWVLKRYSEKKKTSDPTILYLNHFLGEAGADKFLQYLNTSPNAPADSVFTNAAASAGNKPIFYKEGGKGAPRTVKEVYEYLSETKIGAAAKTLGIDAPRALAITAPNTRTSSINSAASSASNVTPSSIIKVSSNGTNNGYPIPPKQAFNNDDSFSASQVYKRASVPIMTPNNEGVLGTTNNTNSISMKAAESILTNSLKVQTDILKVLQQIKTSMEQRSSSQQAPIVKEAVGVQDNTASNKPSAPYTPPDGLVSMGRRKF
jgi:hypothetical protein